MFRWRAQSVHGSAATYDNGASGDVPVSSEMAELVRGVRVEL